MPPRPRYESIQDVPPNLGTWQDYYFQGRNLVKGAEPQASVVVHRRGGRHLADLYTIHQTTSMNLSQSELREHVLRRACPECGDHHTNRQGKVVSPEETPCPPA